MEKFNKKVVGWKSSSLSQVGKCQLVKSTLEGQDSLLTRIRAPYSFLIPKRVDKEFFLGSWVVEWESFPLLTLGFLWE